MARRETSEDFKEPTGPVAARPFTRSARRVLGGLLGLLVSLLGPAVAIADPAALAALAGLPEVSAAPPASIQFVDEQFVDEAPPREPILPVVEVPDVTSPAQSLDLTELLFVPGARAESWRPQTADEMLADAVALGTNPDLEPPKPFRKKSRDLFRTETPVSIWRQEMVMRLRLRAKAKRAVSVEFHF
jgi:hypothetical protein